MKYQLQIKTHNWEGNSPIITKEISLEEIERYKEFIKAINANSGINSFSSNLWNWFNNIPSKWDGNKYVPDVWKICGHIKEKFEYTVTDVNLIIDFFNKFTPNGCDGISNIKIFKVEEIKI